jgi:hypothetical protein
MHAFLNSALDGGEMSASYLGLFSSEKPPPVQNRLEARAGPTESLASVGNRTSILQNLRP